MGNEEIEIKKSTLIIGVVVIIAFIILVSFLIGLITNPKDDGDNKQTIEFNPKNLIDDDTILGNKNSKVTIIEFSDYQCPFCRKAYKEIMPLVKENYVKTNKAKLIFRDFPLTRLHPSALIAALAAECADDQNKFWEMHDKIFDEQNKKGSGTVSFGPEDLKKWSNEIGINNEDFNSCLDSEKYIDEVKNDLVQGTAFGISGTPTYFIFTDSIEKKDEIKNAVPSEFKNFVTFINNEQLTGVSFAGAMPFELFKSVIEAMQ